MMFTYLGLEAGKMRFRLWRHDNFLGLNKWTCADRTWLSDTTTDEPPGVETKTIAGQSYFWIPDVFELREGV